MPVHVYGYTVFVHAHRSVVLAGFPVPKPKLAVCVTRGQKLAVWTELQSTGVARAHVPSKALFTIQLKISMLYVVDYNAVVHALACEVLSIRMQGCCWNCVHIWFTDVLCDYRDAELPNVYFFVVGGRNKLLAVLNESETIN